MSEPVSALVLAGGKSRRLGLDKTLVRLGGSEQNLLATVVATLRQITDEVLVVIGEDDRPNVGGRVVRDVYPGRGSLGGVYSGLRETACEYSLVVACDMPFLNIDLIKYMLSLPRDYELLIPHIADYVEPLHAVYSKACLPTIETMLSDDRLMIASFVDQVRVRYVEEAEIDQFDPQHLSFFNINTPEQLAKAQAIVRSRQQR